MTKRALSRVLVVMVSLGYSVVRPHLGSRMPRVAGLGMAYFVLAMSYDLLLNLPSNNKHLGQSAYMDSLTVLVLLLALVDIIFYMWILQALMSTISYLERKNQSAKLLLFRRFRCVLIISVLFSLAWSIYSMAASVDGYYEQHWKQQWSINAVWEVLYVMILIAIAFLWRPSRFVSILRDLVFPPPRAAHVFLFHIFRNSQRYAYSQQLATSDPDENFDDEFPDRKGRTDGDDDDDDDDDDIGTESNFETLPSSEDSELDAEIELSDHKSG